MFRKVINPIILLPLGLFFTTFQSFSSPKKDYIDETKNTIGNDPRVSFFDVQKLKLLGQVGFKKGLIGPGPGSINISSNKRYAKKKNSLAREQRYVGQPHPNYKDPGAGDYEFDKQSQSSMR